VPTAASIHVWPERACTAPGACVGKTCPHLLPPNGFPSLCKKPKACNERLTKSRNSYSSVGEAKEITDVTNFMVVENERNSQLILGSGMINE